METSLILFRLLLAVFIGGIVGYERSSNNSKAGLRTYILVSVSMAMIALIQLAMMETAYTSAAEHPNVQEAVKLDYGRL
ncbi:MgtC/SapB family protein, partial [Carnobacterium sp.]|uniref:MgtC/SapB family protein n=1 Tax=Carnobacterium sp. TaxID=48221 RepID=UPI0028A74DBB